MLVVLASMLAGSTQLAADERSPCFAADALLEGRLYDKAIAAYLDLLKPTPVSVPALTPSPAPDCAATGLKKALDAQVTHLFDAVLALQNAGFHDDARKALATIAGAHPEATNVPSIGSFGSQCEVADKLIAGDPKKPEAAKNNLYDQAIAAYTDLLKLPTPPSCAADGLNRAIAGQIERTFNSIKFLDKAGYHDDARVALKTLLNAHPEVGVPDDLAWMVNDQSGLVSFWETRIVGRLVPFITGTLQVVGWLAVLAAAILFAWKYRRASKRAELRFGAFTATDTATGPALSAGIRDNIRRMRRENGGPKLYLNDETAQPFVFPLGIGDAVPTAKILTVLTPFLGWLIPPVFVLDGVLGPTTPRGAGFTLTLTRKTKTFATVTLWQDEYLLAGGADPAKSPSPTGLFATVGAAWTLYQIAPDASRNGFIAKDWRSYAYFSAASDWMDVDDDVRAKNLTLRALDRDPGNLFARCNLVDLEWGSVDIAKAERTDIERLIDNLGLVEDALVDLPAAQRGERVQAPQPTGKPIRVLTATPSDPANRLLLSLFFREQYIALAFHLHLSERWSIPAAIPATRGRLLLLSLEELLIGDEATRATGSLRDLLTMAEGEVLGVYALALAHLQGPREATIPFDIPATGDDLLRQLRAGDLDHRAVAEFLRRARGDDRAHYDRNAAYNLACYDACVASKTPAGPTRDDALGAALSDLADAAEGEGPSLAEWARKDPTLSILKRERLKEFDKILAGCLDPASRSPRHAQSEPTTLIAHFAYGSNMDTARLETRVGHIRKRGIARLREREIRFDKRGDDGSGKTNLARVRDGEVWGVVFDLNEAQIEALAKIEKGYHEEIVRVQLDGTHELQARAFVADEAVTGLLPTRPYLDHLILGAREHDLPLDYRQMLEAVRWQ